MRTPRSRRFATGAIACGLVLGLVLAAGAILRLTDDRVVWVQTHVYVSHSSSSGGKEERTKVEVLRIADEPVFPLGLDRLFRREGDPGNPRQYIVATENQDGPVGYPRRTGRLRWVQGSCQGEVELGDAPVERLTQEEASARMEAIYEARTGVIMLTSGRFPEDWRFAEFVPEDE